MKNGLSRRAFLAGLLATTAMVPVAGLAASSAAAPLIPVPGLRLIVPDAYVPLYGGDNVVAWSVATRNYQRSMEKLAAQIYNEAFADLVAK